MELLAKILLNRRIIKISLLLFILWLFTGSSIIGIILGTILALYSLSYFINKEPFVRSLKHDTYKAIIERFGGVFFAIFALLLFINIHSQTTLTEGIVILIIFIPAFILAFRDTFYKGEAKFTNKLAAISFLGLFITVGILMVIQPEPSTIGIGDTIIIFGMLVDLLRGDEKARQKDE
jgi:threonine/homoserine/homoserine lactone efflux protein